MNKRQHLKHLNKVVNKYSSKKSLDSYIDREFINEEGYAVININLYNGVQLFEPFSYKNQLELNSEIYDYIDNKVAVIPKDIPLKVIFRGKKISEKNQNEIKKLIREHYAIKLYEKQKELNLNRDKTIILAMLGIAMLFLYFYLSVRYNNTLFLEIFSIVASFSIWEAADFFILGRTKINVERFHITQKLIQEIEFEE